MKKHAQTKEEIQLIMQETDTALSTQTPIDCQPCRIQLPDIVAYEKHYEAKHANVCLTCNKIFPGFEWLRLHLDEIHNTLLLIRKERGEKIHACYVESCTKFFSTPKMRRLHLIDKHKYPAYFPFDLVYTGTLDFKQLKKRDRKNKKRIKESKEDVDMGALANDTNSFTFKENKAKTKRKTKENKITDVEMGELTEAFDKKLKIPKAIQFGKQSSRSLLRRTRRSSNTMGF